MLGRLRTVYPAQDQPTELAVKARSFKILDSFVVLDGRVWWPALQNMFAIRAERHHLHRTLCPRRPHVI